MHRIEIKYKGKMQTVYAANGEKLSSVLMKNGFNTEHPCGGKGICGKCTVSVNGKNELSCRYKINSDITVVLPEDSEILSVSGTDETGKITDNVCLAFDIGTTTLALALISLDEGKVIKVITMVNPQRAFGADVVSRIEYCRRYGVKELHEAVISALKQMLSDILNEYGLAEIDKLYVSGNTTMLHLFFGVDCSAMGVSPYTPQFIGSKRVRASQLSIEDIGEVISLPNISAFVGADIVAGLNFTGMPEAEKYNILIDLGTNAEVVLYSDKKVLCTSAAAGPCFEGANISCGMSAAEGAVYAYSQHEKAKIIGNKAAEGICGTGLIDVISELVRSEIIDETGYMECGKFLVAENVFLLQEDIRQFQLAKSAVYSAMLTLMDIENVSFNNIANVYISGGFSAKLNIVNAVCVGLLPFELKSKYIALNNSSLLGTVKYACEQNELSVYTNNAEYVDLAANQMFSRLFIDNMMFSFFS